MKYFSLNILRLVILFIVIGVNIFLLHKNYENPWQQFTDQSFSFVHGRLDNQNSISQDMVVKDGKFYWPNGPFPAVLMMPFVSIWGMEFHQGTALVLLISTLVYFLYKLTRLHNYSHTHTFYFICAFLFGSVAIDILSTPSGWMFSQAVCLVLLTICLYEFETKRRYLVMGILIGGIIATRPTSAFFVLLILGFILFQKVKIPKKIVNLVLLSIPILTSVVMLAWFNWVRFGSITDNGYLTNDVGPVSEPLRAMGMFTTQHIPMNVYWYFLAGPQTVTDGSAHLIYPYIKADKWGTSLLFISPFFFYILRTFKDRNWYVRGLWVVSLLTLGLLLMYFNTGWHSFGPRYTADFLPLIYVLSLYAFSKATLSEAAMNIITLSSVFNTYLVFVARIYPELY
jgi:hypothetical protein